MSIKTKWKLNGNKMENKRLTKKEKYFILKIRGEEHDHRRDEGNKKEMRIF